MVVRFAGGGTPGHLFKGGGVFRKKIPTFTHTNLGILFSTNAISVIEYMFHLWTVYCYACHRVISTHLHAIKHRQARILKVCTSFAGLRTIHSFAHHEHFRMPNRINLQ